MSVRTFVIPFYYGSGSATAKSYGSYGSGFGSATLLNLDSFHTVPCSTYRTGTFS